MMMEKGTATSLRDMGDKFLKFAQKSNDTTQAWNLVDDRLHSFYGATLQVPITKEVTRYVEEEYEVEEEHTLLPGQVYNGDFSSVTIQRDVYWDSGKIEPFISKYNQKTQNSKTCYIYTSQLFLKEDDTYYGDVTNYIIELNKQLDATTSDYKVLVIPRFPDSKWYEKACVHGDTFVDDIVKHSSDIHADYVVDTRNVINNSDLYDLSEKYDVFSGYKDMYLSMESSTTSYQDSTQSYISARSKYVYKIAVEKNGIKENIIKQIGTSLFANGAYTDSGRLKLSKYLNDNVYSKISKDINAKYSTKQKVKVKKKRKVPKKFMETNPYFYISLQHTDVNKNTYADWVRKEVDYPFYRANNFNGINSEGITHKTNQAELYNHNDLEILSWNRSRNRYVRTKYNSDNIENPFIDTGEFLAIGAHTLFDENLWMCEQPQITCEKEAYAQFNRQNLLPARDIVYDYGRHDIDIPLPSFPSVGCPWFTMSDENKAEFGNTLTYWFTKNDYSATITYRVTRPLDEQDVYQSMSFGLMDCVDDATYKFPLFVAGGSGALTQDIWVFGRTTGGVPTYTQGNSYTLDIKNIALSNSNLLYPCKFNGSNVSNFRILSPEGIWKDIYNMQQDATVVHYFSCGSIWNWGYPLNEPKWLEASNLHGAYPSRADATHTTDTYRIKEPTNKLKFASPFTRVIVYQTDAIEHKENGIYGMLPSNYMSWSKTMPSGEVTISGKKYLSVPNGWDGRLRHYPTEVGVVVNDKWQNKPALAPFDTAQLHNKFDNKMLIPLEEGA